MKTVRVPADLVHKFNNIFWYRVDGWPSYWQRKFKKAKKCENHYAYEIEVSDTSYRVMKSHLFFESFLWKLSMYN